MSLFSELSRRNVFRVAITYVIAAWVIAQVADLVLENIGAPKWVMQTLLLLLVIGFAIAAIIAWAYEVTPDGIKRESDVVREESTTGQTGRRLNLVTIGLSVLAITLLVVDRIQNSDATGVQQPTNSVSESLVTPVEVSAIEATDEMSIVAVLPFKAIGSEDGGFLAGGLHDDLLTRLARLEAFKVISRTSMMEYADTTKNMRQIGAELGAQYILEGGVQALGDRVRVNAQLIDSRTDEHIWADTYDRQLTAANLFDIQSDLAFAIAGQLKAALNPSDKALMRQVPTQNMEAYSAYLRGLKLRDTGGHNSLNVTQAIEAFEQATSLDPGFAQAWAHLSIEYSRNSQGTLGSAERESALATLQQAEQLQANSYEVGIAQVVYHYRVRNEFVQALTALEALEQEHTLDAAGIMLRAYLLRRTGNVKEAYSAALQARQLDPRSIQIAAALIPAAYQINDCDASAAHARAAMALNSESLGIRTQVAMYELQCNGNGARANELMLDMQFEGYYQHLVAQLAALAARDWSTVLAILEYELPSEGPYFSTINKLDRAKVLQQLGRERESSAVLAEAEADIEALKENSRFNGRAGYAFTMARYFSILADGEAVRYWVGESKRRAEVESKGDVARRDAYYLFSASIFATAGLISEAIDEIRLSLESPGGDRFPLIDALPEFEILKDDPAYDVLRLRYQTNL